jgi:AcrR family transcriptional regulator
MPIVVKPTKRQELGERSRKDILDAASRLMAADGYDGASVKEIAKESGLPVSSIYWHFESKAGVLEAVMERGANRFFAEVDLADIAADASPRDVLRAQLLQAAVAIRRNPDFLRLFIFLLLSRGIDETIARVRRNGRDRLHQQIQRAFARDGDELARQIADELVDLAVGMFDGVFLAVQNNPQLDYEPLLMQAADAIAALGSEIVSRRQGRPAPA